METTKEGAWQPMGTAPKDGTKILLAGLNYNVGPGFWFDVQWWDGEWWNNDNDQATYPPVCWMAIPQPPEDLCK
jgi:hypothetical protein